MQQQGGSTEKVRAKETVRTQRATMSMEVKGDRLSREEIESLVGQEVNSAKKVMKYLESTLLTVPGVPYTSVYGVGGCAIPDANATRDQEQ